ncbi:type II toxin-antitoxin system VapB family antitoxin [Phycicoccus sp. HDW14]|uniref:type II toxin-antitoxin system VapB family antitoxin n=1 Tax=Phycicoccus sp. HDW14 TaxID=2714941 RepID=UPI0014082F81|nr:type II toxin-antitoxin system VapB family antitoxin [Phycicoccus sp. HDW14]QIM20602.1 type II toxin-antitoxin system VapB family antitoxin [Phycicoccus sp. HDW14]
MSLNIKNERVHALARAAAARTGRSQTSVIEDALEQYLAALDRPEQEEAWRQSLDDILARIDARLTDEDRRALTTDDLYDENGLPV